jgi:hypothetical protein
MKTEIAIALDAMIEAGMSREAIVAAVDRMALAMQPQLTVKQAQNKRAYAKRKAKIQALKATEIQQVSADSVGFQQVSAGGDLPLNDSSEPNSSTLSTKSKTPITTRASRDNVAEAEAPRRDETEFQEFWRVWPNKAKRQDSAEAYWRAREGHPARGKPTRDPVSHDRILSGANAFVAKMKSDKAAEPNPFRFCPHASTWLNGSRWDEHDYIDPAVKAAANQRAELSIWRNWVERFIACGGRTWEGERRDLPPVILHMASPRPGLPGCKVPLDILAEHASQLATLGVRAA